MSPKVSIVVTTIFEPKWLKGYLNNIEKYGRKNNATIHIICDKKTPQSVFDAASEAVSSGFNIDCPSLEEQESWLSSIGADPNFIPWNTDNRRNIGFLRALQQGCELLISIDDDNYCLDDVDFIGCHSVVGSTAQDCSEKSTTGGRWFNACAQMTHQSTVEIYPRGFLYAARQNPELKAEICEIANDSRKVAVNAGLWTDDPDVDAISRLALRPEVSAVSNHEVVMADNTWCPINTQNTALSRDAIPAYYYIRMGFPLKGLSIDRFGDIMSGFFLLKCVYHMGEAARFGDPIARHLRSPHNLLKDLYHELAGITLLEDLIPWLIELELTGSTYEETYLSLANAIEMQANEFSGFVWDDGGREFLKETADCMRHWLKLLNTVSA